MLKISIKRLFNLVQISMFFLPVSILLSCLIVVVILFSMPPVVKQVYDFAGKILPSQNILHGSAEEDTFFKDISLDSPYYQAVSFLKNRGIVEGFEDNTYRPERTLNRGEFVKTAVTASNMFPLEMTYVDCFKDVNKEWFATAVCFAKSKDWVSGDSSGSFNPEKEITRAEGLKILVKIFELTKGQIPQEKQYEDVTSNDWFYDYIDIALSNGIIDSSSSADLFFPEHFLTRGDAALWLYKTLKLVQ